MEGFWEHTACESTEMLDGPSSVLLLLPCGFIVAECELSNCLSDIYIYIYTD